MRTSPSFLPVPPEFDPVLIDEELLPLEYVAPDWLITVCTDAVMREYAFTFGHNLHRHWEKGALHHFSRQSTTFPSSAIRVLCPDGRLLAMHILAYDHRSPVEGRRPRANAASRKRAAHNQKTPGAIETNHHE